MPSVLDLPLERQQAIAKLFNQTVEEWRIETQKRFDRIEKHLKEIEKSPPFQFASKEREREVAERYDHEQLGWRVVAQY